MNKAEKQRLEELETALRIAKAFRFTEEVKPDIPVPQGFGQQEAYGFIYHAYKGVRVERSVSGPCSHGSTYRDDITPVITSQRGVQQFSSRLLAFRAGRYELEQEFAGILADIDEQIEEELAKNA